jgi:E3 ubiquitin-protein ligase HUWE1
MSEQAARKPLDPVAKDPVAKLRSNPPQIPPVSLRPIANLLTTGECSAKTFQHTMSSIQNLSYLPDVKDVIAAELKSRAEALGDALYCDLRELTGVLSEIPEESEVSASALSKFSSASADQAKLLRLLKMLDFMYLPRSSVNAEGEAPNDASEGDIEQIQKIYRTFRFDPLWRQLSDALDVIEEKSSLEHVATVLLPLIETLMVVSKHIGPKAQAPQSPRAAKTPLSPKSPIIGLASGTTRAASDDLFVAFTDSHRKLLNMMVRNNPSLMSGSFALLVNNPKVLDFDNKRNYFNQQLRRRPHSRDHHTTLQLNVRRAHVFEDSYQYLHRKTGDQIKYGKLSIRFYEEEGVDAGGVTREWFQILARQMFNPDYALFQPCAGDKLTYQPNRASAINPDHLSFFKFVGRVIGKAIYDGRLLDAYFARSLYRQILGKPVDYRDVEWVDPEYYNSLCWILENDPAVLDMSFTVDADEVCFSIDFFWHLFMFTETSIGQFGLRRVIELKEGGSSIPVTQDNKREFVQLSAQYRLLTSIKDQIDALLGGFYEIIPKELIAIVSCCVSVFSWKGFKSLNSALV